MSENIKVDVVPTDANVTLSVLLKISNDVIAEPPDDGMAYVTVTSNGDGFGLAMSSVGAELGAGGGVGVV